MRQLTCVEFGFVLIKLQGIIHTAAKPRHNTCPKPPRLPRSRCGPPSKTYKENGVHKPVYKRVVAHSKNTAHIFESGYFPVAIIEDITDQK